MDIEEIKNKARLFKPSSVEELSDKVLELKNKGVSFLACVAFVQANKGLTLAEAREFTYNLPVWTPEEKSRINYAYKLMMSEFEDDDE